MVRDQVYERLGKGFSREALLDYASKHLSYIREYSKDAGDKLAGIAEGAGLPIEEVTLLNMAEELGADGVARRYSPLYNMHCTSFGATGVATIGGETYVGQNWDYCGDLYWEGHATFLQREKHADGREILAYTAPGFLAWAGMNSDGICLSWNSMPRVGLKIGVPTYVIVDEVLRARSIGEALAAVVRAKRAGCFNFVIADPNGELYDVEATPEGYDASYYRGTLGHSNHFVNMKQQNQEAHFVDWLTKEGDDAPNLHTIVRLNRMNRMLEESRGSIELQTCERFLRDHVNFPSSICFHGTEGVNEFTFESWVMVPRLREWWIARHPQCKNEYVKYSLPRVACSPVSSGAAV
jgi:isopenicillin-N N-acyltransferase-like protein